MQWIGIENGFLTLMHDILAADALDPNTEEQMADEWAMSAPTLDEIEASVDDIVELEMELVAAESSAIAC